MNLRTDDIQGARPRIRHAPRNLIRQNKAYQNLQYAQQSYQMPSPSYMNNVDLSQSFHERSPKAGYGYIKETEPYYYPEHQKRSGDFLRYQKQHQDQIRQKVPNQYILPKDAPAINYDLYRKEMQRNPEIEANSRQEQRYQRDNLHKRSNSIQLSSRQPERHQQYQIGSQYEQPYKEYQRVTSSNKPNSQRSSSSQQRNPPESSKQLERPANIFRGLGYNIITNTKFSYDMENNLKSSTSKWL